MKAAMKEKIVMRGSSTLELLRRAPSAVARSAQRTGNASGCHGKPPAKQARIAARHIERRALRGEVE